VDKEGNFRVAVIGYGYWGPNLVRNFSTADGAVVSHICDLSAERLKMASRAYPSAAASCSLDVILADETVDIVAIATPVRSHYDLAIRALEAGKHVLVEKPLAASSAEARSICASAERNGRQVFIDHTFVFTPAVRKMRELLHENHIGLPLYYDSIRINLGIFQPWRDCRWY
jgi:predicted dehydrogenase